MPIKNSLFLPYLISHCLSKEQRGQAEKCQLKVKSKKKGASVHKS